MTAPGGLPAVLCIGETMGLVAPSDDQPLIASEELVLSHAGAESNVARYLAEAGVHVAWVGAVGEDPFGELILTDLAGHGIDTRWAERRPGATGVFFKDPRGSRTEVHYYRSTSVSRTLGPSDADRWPLAAARLVHFSGITQALSESCADLIDHLLGGSATTSFDVNYRPQLWESSSRAGAELLRSARAADIVFVGLDEARSLWGTETAEAVGELVLRTGGRLLVKDGANEAVELVQDADGTTSIERAPTPPVDVVEPVGAGDAFAAGYLAAFLAGHPADTRLAAGHALAGWTMGTTLDYRSGFPGFARA